MKPSSPVQKLATIALFSFLASSGQAALINIQFDDFEGTENNHIDTPTNEPLTNWDDVTNGYVPGAGAPGNARTDQAGYDGAGGDGGKGVRVRSSTGAMVLENPMLLTTLGATSVTISFDLKEHTAGYEAWLDYSAAGDFSDTVNLAIFDGSGTLDTWVPVSYTLVDGVDGITFSDTAQFRIGKQSRGVGANGTFHVYDNISIDADVIPEPSVVAFFSLAGLALLRRRRR